MVIKIEVDDKLPNTEVVIRCKGINDEITKIEEALKNINKLGNNISFYKDMKEYYIKLQDVLFFETDESLVYAHIANDSYSVKRKLYELEEILPKNFIRVSKSTIININHILSISRTFPSTNLIEFNKSHKQVYVSRFYYKYLDMKLNERRSYENEQ